MNRAEVVHTASHIYVGRWKIGPIKNDRVESREISTFPNKKYTLFTAGDLSILPAVPKYYSSSSTEIRLYESLLNFCGGDSRQRSEFADFGALAPWKTRFFIKFHGFHVPRPQVEKVEPAQDFCSLIFWTWDFAHVNPHSELGIGKIYPT